MKKKFTDDEKIRVWMHYMVTQVALNTYPLELNMNHKKPEDRVGKDAIVSVYTQFFTFNGEPKYPIRDFDSFCNDKNDLSSDTLYGWYFRFKHEIFKTHKSN